MVEELPAEKRNMAWSHWVVLSVWGVLCGWLVISLLIGVITALFYGDGPINLPVSP